jgi:hypothetical protein
MADKDFTVKNGIVVNTSFSANSTTIALGLTSTNTVINTSTISIGGNVIANSLGVNNAFNANNAAYLGGTIASGYQTTAGLSANVATLTANNATNLGGTIASGYQTTAGLSANVAVLTSNNTSFVGTVTAANVVSNAQLSSNLSSYALKAGTAFTGQVNASANVNVTGNINVASGVFNGNGSGLTSVSYIATSTSATDVAVFSGGDSGAWTRASGSPIFYPTIPAYISTLTVGVQLDLFIKQVADEVASSNDAGTAGAGNPQLRYRIVKGPSNTALFTSEYNTLSTPGVGGGYVVTAIDTSPTAGNTIGYEIQYWWRSGSADPNVNVGTIAVSATNTPQVTGSGTFFTGTLNPRLQIARSSNPTTWKKINYIDGNNLLHLEADWGNSFTATTYVVQDPYANVIMDQTNLVLTFTGYK